MAAERIAAKLYIAPFSLPRYIRRLKQAVSAAFGGAPARSLSASAVGGAGGYRLAGRWASDPERSPATGWFSRADRAGERTWSKVLRVSRSSRSRATAVWSTT